MAASFTTLSSYPTVQVVSPQQVIDVLRIGFSTIPSGVVAYANAPGKQRKGQSSQAFVDQMGTTYIEPIATGIESVMGLGYVAAITHEEDVSPAGLLTDWLACVVEYAPASLAQPGPFQVEVRLPIWALHESGPIFGALVRDPLNAAFAAMQQLAAL